MQASVVVLILCFTLSCLSKELKATPNGVEQYQAMVQQQQKHQSQSSNQATTFTIYAHTAIADPGSRQRIVDVVGVVNPVTGALASQTILASVIEAEILADGLAAFDYNTNQVFYSSDGAFGGTVFYANMGNNTAVPPQSYYLSPVAYLGYDPVSGSRVIAGVNTPAKSFLVLDKPSWGPLTLFQFPAALKPSANAAFDGKSMNYYSALCTQVGTCTISSWNIQSNSLTSFPLSCLASNSYLTGEMWINPLDAGAIHGLVGDTIGDYYIIRIDPSSKSCKVSPALSNLPPKPVIIIAQDVGHLSGNLYVSLTSNVYNAINVYDLNLKFVKQIKTTPQLYEDIFVQEKN